MDVQKLVDGLKAGDRRTIARLISLVEDEAPELAEIVRAIGPLARGAYTVGLTGSPGVGKSTLTAALVGVLRARERNQRVAVLAVDPSSPFTGGALLGDRLRMQRHATDPEVFIRSMATRGRLGGLAWATPHALRILDASGAQTILLETVGVGQAEVEISNASDTTIVVLAPGLGDSVQANKAGLLEIADVFVVNKADREGAKQARRDIEQMLDLGTHAAWRPPVLLCSAESGDGVEEVWNAVEEHRAALESSDELTGRRRRRAAREISEIALVAMRKAIGEIGEGDFLDQLADEVVAGRMDPYTAADKLMAQIR
jgi:LAO/AO transport system kinase